MCFSHTDIPLTLKFVNNTPYVDETSVEAYIQASRNDVQMLCKIGGDKSIPEENCELVAVIQSHTVITGIHTSIHPNVTIPIYDFDYSETSNLHIERGHPEKISFTI